MADTLGDAWKTIAVSTFTSNGATLQYIVEAKLDSQSTSENKSYISTRARTVMTGYEVSSYNVHMSCTGCKSRDGDNSTRYYFITGVVLEGSTTVNHNADGSGSVTISGVCTGNYGMNLRPSGTVALPKIDRYSIVTTFNNFNIENGFSFGFTDYLSDKTLTLTCKMGDVSLLTKTYTSSAGAHIDSIIFTEEQLTNIYNNIGASNKSAKFSLTLATSGISTSSTKEATGTLIAASNAPTIGLGTITEADAKMLQCGVLGDEIVRYLSTKSITASATAKHGATIASVKIKNGSDGAEYEMTKSDDTYSKALSNLTANSFILTATDSRGLTASMTMKCTIKNYSRPSVEKIDFGRTSEISSTGYVRPVGSYWSGEAGNVTNSVTWTYRISSTSAAQPATAVGTTWRGEASLVSGTLLRENAYECVVTVTDALGQSASLTVSIGPAKLSAWIGKETMRAEGFVGNHYIGVFPVGAIYMSATDTNPATYFGGTWVQIAQGRALIGVGSNNENTVSTYGSASAGTFSPSAGEMGGAYRHRHFMNGNDTTGPRAAIGSVDNNVNTIGFASTTLGAYAPASTKQYALAATMLDQNVSHTFNHHTSVFGMTRYGDNNSNNISEDAENITVAPYLAVYIWQRTA